jgi:DNA-binding MarR family transcriptional regulator
LIICVDDADRRTQRPPPSIAVQVKLDYTTLLLDTFNEEAKAVASRIYKRECGVGLRELRLLRFTAREPGLVLSRLIELARLEKTLASKAMSVLVRRGLVERTISRTDARHVELHLTEAGRRVVEEAEPIGRRMEGMLLSQLTRQEAATFRRCLRKLSDGHQAVAEDIEAYLRRRAPAHGRAGR